MTLHLQPTPVLTDSADTDGLLVFHGRSLVAVLVRLSDDHGEEAGKWYLEAGFGQLNSIPPRIFATLDEARDWMMRRLG